MFRHSLLLLLILAILPLAAMPLLSQNTSKTKVLNDYKLNVNFKTNVFHHYEFTEESKIVRTHSDSATMNFERRVHYYFCLLQNSMPKDGFYTIKVMLDSMKYEFYENGVRKYIFDSQDDESDAPFNHRDFLAYSIPLGREFFVTYTPYNEVAKVEGEMLDESRKMVNDKETGIADQDLNYLWNRGLSDNFLVFLTNVQRNLIPSERVQKDSVWLRPFQIFVDGVRYQDTAKVMLTEFSPRQYVVEAELDSLVAEDDFFSTSGIDELIETKASKGSGKSKTIVSPQGQIKSVEMDLKTQFQATIRKETFTQSSDTKYTWILNKVYK